MIKFPAMFEAKNIRFSRGGSEILSGVTFSVDAGEVLAITGANGAGKTTLLKILAGIWLPTSGTAISDGVDILEEPLRHRRRLGWLGETAPADDDLTVKGYLKYRARLKGEQSGQRKRVALAEAALLRPRLLLLDDLFAGLDAESRESVVTMIGSFRSFATVIVTGHETEWFSRLEARVLTLKEGRIA